MILKIIIGVVKHTSILIVWMKRCGGVAERKEKNHLDVKCKDISAKMMMKKMSSQEANKRNNKIN